MTIIFNIMHRFSGRIVFTANIEAGADTPYRVQLGLAIRAAVGAHANLAHANLAGAYLADANLADANLAHANLADANLADAYLADANLADANLAHANLAGAYLADANLAGANLAGAYLADANLAHANLAGANLAGAKWSNGVTITRAPLYLVGLRYKVTILDNHMQIGCQLHTLAEWSGFDDEVILRMDGKSALTFWRAHKSTLLGLAIADGRGVAPAPQRQPVEA